MNKQKNTYKKQGVANSTAKRKKILIEALTNSLGIVTVACKTCDISRDRFYVWYREDENFKKAVDDVDKVALDFVESQHYQLIKEKNPANIIFHLKTKGKCRGYIERSEVEHGGKIELNLKELTDQELEDLANEC